ncbi:MAG: F0F1 ATP synthase subunit delta [Novosphingobium sp.]|nr:F0F1 ATP synthase subunit delta [Novosphingobium sp.]
MRIDWWTLGLQTINLLVLLWIMSRFLFRPIARIVAERQAEIDRILGAARDSDERARAAGEEAKKTLAEAAKQRASAIEEANREAEGQKEALLAEARTEADRLRDMARQEANRISAEGMARNDERASQLAVEIAGRLFERLPAEARVAGFVDGLAEALGELPPSARDEVVGTEGVVAIRAPRTLSGKEDRAISDALTKVLDREVTLAVDVDPGVIAGLEIETAHATVCNSFRNDLAQIASGLARDGQSRA